MSSKAERANWPVRQVQAGSEEPSAYAHLTPEERVGMVWEITQAVWAFMGHGDADPTLQRHIGRVVSRGR